MQVTNIPIDGDKRETTQHGSGEFPLAVYHSTLSQNILGYTDWHWHAEIQLCLVTRGQVRFFVDGKSVLLDAGEGIYIGSGVLHAAKPEKDPDSAYACVDVASGLLGLFPGSAMEKKYVSPYLRAPEMGMRPLRAEIPWQKVALESITRICVLYADRPVGYEYGICAALAEVWLRLVENRDAAGCGGNRSNETARAILNYIEQHYAEHITIAHIARELSFSTSECCRIFKRVTGETIFSRLLACRVTHAAELLRDSALSVSSIAYETGFGSTSYFIKVFREHTGDTPLQYRKRMEEQKGESARKTLTFRKESDKISPVYSEDAEK